MASETQAFGVRLPCDTLDAVRRVAVAWTRREGRPVTRGEVVRVLLERGLAAEKGGRR